MLFYSRKLCFTFHYETHDTQQKQLRSRRRSSIHRLLMFVNTENKDVAVGRFRVSAARMVLLWHHCENRQQEHTTVTERAQRAANRKNTCKLRKQLPQFYNAHAANAHNTTKQRNALQIKCIWLYCEHLQHLLSNWWRCFLDLLVLFLFACVFWSCSALSSLGHRNIQQTKTTKRCQTGVTTMCCRQTGRAQI